MTKLLGVSINASKSIRSRNMFEFAKRLFSGPSEVSPLTWTQLLRVPLLSVLPGFLADTVERRNSKWVISKPI